MPDTPDDRPLVHRRGADGRMEVGPDWETLIERQIREAMEEGAFDELPHQGSPLPNDDNPHAGDLGLAFHVLRNAGIAPPWIEADKEVRSLLERCDALLARAPRIGVGGRARARTELTRLVADANAAIARLNAEAPTTAQHRRPLDPDAELARLDAAFGRRDGSGPEPS
jgi:hypothetical protein